MWSCIWNYDDIEKPVTTWTMITHGCWCRTPDLLPCLKKEECIETKLNFHLTNYIPTSDIGTYWYVCVSEEVCLCRVCNTGVVMVCSNSFCSELNQCTTLNYIYIYIFLTITIFYILLTISIFYASGVVILFVSGCFSFFLCGCVSSLILVRVFLLVMFKSDVCCHGSIFW